LLADVFLLLSPSHLLFDVLGVRVLAPAEDRTMFLRELKTAFPSTMLSAMDFSVDPCDNFFEYSCGDWQKLATIPPELGGVAKSWDAAQDAADSDLHKIMLKEYPKDSVYRKVHNWFKSCMDTEAVKDKGATPLKPWLSKVRRDGHHHNYHNHNHNHKYHMHSHSHRLFSRPKCSINPSA